MEQIAPAQYTQAQRMELRGLIRLASEIIAQYWPMRTFVHHNPLHSLEYLPFEEALRRGQDFLEGRGYLPDEIFRAYVRSGRILSRHLDEALGPLVYDRQVVLGSRRVSHGEVLRTCLLQRDCAHGDETLDVLTTGNSDRHSVEALAVHLTSVMQPPGLEERIQAAVGAGRTALGRRMSLPSWCDRTLGTQILDLTNGEMIKWLEAYLDEGYATWPMPGRDQGFYGSWKLLAGQEWAPCGIPDSRRKLARLPAHPEDALLDSLKALGLPMDSWQDYFALQLVALPGWAGFIKWRADQTGYPWQQAYPVDLAQYLAVRSWYEKELVQKACRAELGIDGTWPAIQTYMQTHSPTYFLRRERVDGHLPANYAEQVDQFRQGKGAHSMTGWDALATRYRTECGPGHDQRLRRAAASRLLALADSLEVAPATLLKTPPADLKTLLDWVHAFPESAHGPVWLKAFEAGYREQLLGKLMGNVSKPQPPALRPNAQAVFCIDVRSEPFRRHLEAIGDYETYGFAGFFAVFIRYQAWGSLHETEQFPVIMKAKNRVREIPRSYLSQFLPKHRSRARLVHAGHTLVHDLKENVVTPYVMVESLGWFYSLPIIGKTVFPVWYRAFVAWFQRTFVPQIATTVTVDKLALPEIEEMLVSEQRTIIRRALRERFGLHGSRVTPELVEALRSGALNGDEAIDPVKNHALRQTELPADDITAFIEELRRLYRIDRRWASVQKERITQTGFTLEEQVVTVETALRMMGLTRNFARLVLFCGHGSTSENNPFEAALDCGACGGNEGKANARVLAAMANKPRVRERLVKNGLDIPLDTHFLAGQMDTATDEVRLFDLEDVPPTHRKDLSRLLEDLAEAGTLTSQERCARFPDMGEVLPPHRAARLVRRRSVDWSQVRPEWGLSGNAAFIVGRREVIKGLDLEGRAFLHSYDYREDPTDRLLEVIMTAPQMVAQWISMEHYFSTVDNDVYGAGSKIYHNVVGRLGIISGPWSDLRLGLARQTVMNGEVPYHEPMRLLTVIEAPCARIGKLIERHEVLRRYYHHEWVHLVALEPEKGIFYRYLPTGDWHPVAGIPGMEPEGDR